MVYYRRKNNDIWCGPGTVIGQENKQILVKHGGVYYRCHSCNVMKEKLSNQLGQNDLDSVQNAEKETPMRVDRDFYNFDQGDSENEIEVNTEANGNIRNDRNKP